MMPAGASFTDGAGPLQEASAYYRDRALDQPAVRVLPGEFYVHGSDALMVVTTLGSCVAACLHDPQARLAGMNHFMLPGGGDADGGGGGVGREGSGGRFGVHAMELLNTQLLRRGARRERLQAKIFGGARVMRSLSASVVGERNVAFVRTFLAQEGIPVVASDVMADYPRRISLYPASGRVLCKRLPATQMEIFK